MRSSSLHSVMIDSLIRKDPRRKTGVVYGVAFVVLEQLRGIVADRYEVKANLVRFGSS